MIGSTTLDVFLTGFDELPSVGGDEFTPESISFTDEAPKMILGGNAANTAYVAAGLGLEAAVCSAIGMDAAGTMLTSWLEERHVATEGLRREQSATSVTVVATDRDRARLSFHHPGAGRSFGPDQVPSDLLDRADTVLLSGYHLMTGMRGAGAIAVLSQAARSGATTGIDVGPIVPPLAPFDELAGVIPFVDYLFGNEYELETTTGHSGLDAAAGAALAAGAGHVVAKLGPRGAAAFTPNQRFDAASFPVEVVSTVGAGDSFNAGFLAGLARGNDLAASLLFGNAVAGLVVSHGAGVLGGPNLDQVNALLQLRAS